MKDSAKIDLELEHSLQQCALYLNRLNQSPLAIKGTTLLRNITEAAKFFNAYTILARLEIEDLRAELKDVRSELENLKLLSESSAKSLSQDK